MQGHLARERQQVHRAWQQFMHDGAPQSGVPEGVRASWQRSRRLVPDRCDAPVNDPEAAREAWRHSPLAASAAVRELAGVAEQGDLIVAISDAGGQLLWTHGSPRMQRAAERLNFIPGGRWDEGSVGTNALALTLRTGAPVRVFAAEHYVQAVHDWVCYSAPIRHPESGALVGVLDFSTTWERSTPLGPASVLHYTGLLQDALRAPRQTLLEVQLCGPARVRLGAETLPLRPRQLELLAVLLLCPQGLSLDALHAHLYGDRPVSLNTLKAEVSVLRSLLGGALASRPYRLTLPVRFDGLQVEETLLAGQAGAALDLYGGPLLPASESPLLGYWRSYLDGALREAVLRAGDSETLWRHAARFGDDPQVLDRLLALLPPSDPRRALVAARRAATDTALA